MVEMRSALIFILIYVKSGSYINKGKKITSKILIGC